MSTAPFAKSRRNKLVRHPERGHYDRDVVYRIVDEGLLCHVGFVQDDLPYVIPTLHARDGDRLLLHGSSASRMIKHLGAGNSACVTITLVDGLVLARSVFNHSVNYRSALLFGHGQAITDPDAKVRALLCFMERQLPGRWADVRQPTDQELKATGVVEMSLTSASAKVRTGPPKDDPDDLALPVWAGVLPMHQVIGDPVPAPENPPQRPLPDYLDAFVAARRNGAR
jgi:nitroimidazol reductase NimA-like FMN-containing flavoprotein (pyridoxamine 5'-phosphate oxidase superfamily)